MYVLCRSKFGSPHSHKAKEGEMPTDEAQQLEDLTLANETLREENEKYREALVHIDQIVHVYTDATQLRQRIYAITQATIWTPTANVADPETF
jgi:hypothetical protein